MIDPPDDREFATGGVVDPGKLRGIPYLSGGCILPPESRWSNEPIVVSLHPGEMVLTPSVAMRLWRQARGEST